MMNSRVRLRLPRFSLTSIFDNAGYARNPHPLPLFPEAEGRNNLFFIAVVEPYGTKGVGWLLLALV